MPDDPTPHGGEALHPLPDRAKIPQPKPGAREPVSERRDSAPSDRREADASRRPQLPDHSHRMPADNRHEQPLPAAANDESDGKSSVTRQPAE